MILLIDNYDSFVYNLARYFREMGCETEVRRNDAVSVEEVRERLPRAIIISPGPCSPKEAGVSVDLVRELGGSIPILGVCLGHQAIAVALGGRVDRSPAHIHGMADLVYHQGSPIFSGVPNPFRAGRYHSLCVVDSTLPPDVTVTARNQGGLIMALEHRVHPIVGVQFHPESVLTESGHRLLANFAAMAGIRVAALPQGDYMGSDALGDSPVSTGDTPINW